MWIHYLQGLFYAHKNFPTQITQNMTQGHILPHSGVNTGLVCLLSAIKMQSLLNRVGYPYSLLNTISIPQKRKQCVFYNPPIQIHILFEDHSCWVCVCNRIWPQNPVEHLGGRACASKIRWTRNSQATFQTITLRCLFPVIKRWQWKVCFRGGVKRISEEIRYVTLHMPCFTGRSWTLLQRYKVE